MAEANTAGLSCSICLDLLKNPVALPCGHSFCMKCINDCWDREDQKGVYSCPQCRQTFSTRPAVSKNIALAEVVETLQKAGVQAKPRAQCSSGPEDVECDFCTERKHKAIKSCLVCLASYCETHLQPHYKSPAFKKHKLVEVSRRLQEQICSQHDKLLEVYCRTDQQCICMLCTMDQHKGHDTVSAAAGRAEKQKMLLKEKEKCQQNIQEREQELQGLTKAVAFHKFSAQTALQESERIFTELVKTIEKRCFELKELISAREIAAVSRAEKVMKQLEQEIAELKRRDNEMEELSHTEDTIYFLQSFQSPTNPPGSEDLPTIVVSSFLSFEDVQNSVYQLQETLETCFIDQFEKISSEVNKVLILPPQSREECLQYFCQLTLDTNTANQRLKLSDSDRMATDQDIQNKCSFGYDMYGNPITQRIKRREHPESFNYYSQVLCRESVSEPCYWEVEWSGNKGVSIAVSYTDITRKGNESMFGCNDKSWSLHCSPSSCSFLHNNQETNISVKPTCSKIGVFVDQKAGTLSFYSVSDTMKLLHRVRTTFTQPLYPGFRLNTYSTVKLCT